MPSTSTLFCYMLYGLFQDAPDSLYSNSQGNIFLQDEVDRPLAYQEDDDSSILPNYEHSLFPVQELTTTDQTKNRHFTVYRFLDQRLPVTIHHPMMLTDCLRTANIIHSWTSSPVNMGLMYKKLWIYCSK
ncbi:uncharacterized protein [Dysidea avara]|uniref:uncharacterized protein n=1 Tax=Dysidea avara TaxID=196820 RepID=UPI00331F2458